MVIFVSNCKIDLFYFKVKVKSSVKKVIFVFGKHYYALEAEKAKRKADDVAIVRIEELTPFPTNEIRQVLNEYKNVKEFVWAQEEHRNMGAWFFVGPRFERILGLKLKYAGRDVSNTIVGIGALHAKEVKEVLSKPFEKLEMN
jgi:probable 2-oxoglutarate dehydrogenase E1 component DHKTD1